MSAAYDSLLLVSFGGPEGPDDVLPFLKNVLRGRRVPHERMLEVAEHYQHFGGVSPLNDQNRALLAALRAQLERDGVDLPCYWGNRNWHPLLTDTLRQIGEDGCRRVLAVFTSPYSSYSSCRQYRENLASARELVGPIAPAVDKVRVYYNHPGFIEAMTDRVRAAIESVSAGSRATVPVLFTAHSIPDSMAATCRYEHQLRQSSRLVADSLGLPNWRLVFQSRSGPPTQPWLEPDVCDVLSELADEADQAAASQRPRDVVVVPIGFISDHMEVVYDLDTEARELADDRGLNLIRVPTVGTHPRFVEGLSELIRERLDGAPDRPALGDDGPSHDTCPVDCCVYDPRRP